MIKTLKQIKITFTSISLLVLLCISLILFAAQMAFAQSTNAVGTRATAATQVRAEITSSSAAGAISIDASLKAAEAHRTLFREEQKARAALLDEKRIEIEERRTARVAALETAAQTRIMTRADNATARLSSVVTKLSDLSDRIGTRAEALGERGADVSTVERTLTSVDALLAEASRALLTIDVEVEYVVTSSEPQTTWKDARTAFVDVRDLLHDAHALLRQAVTELKTAAAGVDGGVSAAVRQDTATE